VNRAELVEALAQRATLRKADAARAVEALFGTNGVIAAELRRGARVQITGFGSFHPRVRGARVGRDPRTGKSIQIRAAVAPLFRAGAALKASLNRRGQLRER
jgi:DNA-binding protein HU-beta